MISSDIDTAVADLQAMPPRVKKATARSLNRAIKAAQTFMSRSMAKDTGLKVADVKAGFTLRQAYPENLSASLRAGGTRMPLVLFNAKGPEPSRGRKVGVTYKLRGEGTTLPSAFIATMTSGHRGVFLRIGTGRLPIRELFGPSLGLVFQHFMADGQQVALDAFDKNFTHEFAFQLGKEDEPTDGPDAS